MVIFLVLEPVFAFEAANHANWALARRFGPLLVPLKIIKNARRDTIGASTRGHISRAALGFRGQGRLAQVCWPQKCENGIFFEKGWQLWGDRIRQFADKFNLPNQALARQNQPIWKRH